ncbi:MAG: hypothetical protein CL575_10220 [Altererythrobacter sp.]|nr:hypothetical protein [Altererythrobacter sp.]|tara:strand:+ start:303 stop:569 length:267 start_codon:yes stop_codon:yes gene_type:complete
MVAFIVWSKNQRALEEKRIEATAAQTAEHTAQHVSRIAELEQRVQVLERIVTDRGYDVATQIEALRDQREVEERGSGVPLDVKQGERA